MSLNAHHVINVSKDMVIFIALCMTCAGDVSDVVRIKPELNGLHLTKQLHASQSYSVSLISNCRQHDK